MSEYDGQTYRPKYHEDLVHSEISLPPNAPKEYADRATLWNAVELSEKGQKSQLARMLKASLPNDWSYELAEEVVRDLPIVSGKHLRKISDRTALQSADNAEKFIATKKIDSFESLAKFTADTEQKYGQLDSVHLSKGQKLSRLKELSKMYALYEPYRTTYKESQSLKRLAKMKFDREHKESLAKYPEMRERLQNLLEQGEKITPKQWKAEIQSLQAEYDSIGREKSKTATELAYAEVISYNKKNLERELQNESRQHNKQQSKAKRREEEI